MLVRQTFPTSQSLISNYDIFPCLSVASGSTFSLDEEPRSEKKPQNPIPGPVVNEFLISAVGCQQELLKNNDILIKEKKQLAVCFLPK